MLVNNQFTQGTFHLFYLSGNHCIMIRTIGITLSIQVELHYNKLEIILCVNKPLANKNHGIHTKIKRTLDVCKIKL